MIPREVIFGNPEKVLPKISPDGKRLAYLAPYEGVLNIWVKTIGESDDRLITNDRGRGINEYFWAYNNRQILFLRDSNGDENWHIFVISSGGGEATDLTPVVGCQANVVALNKNFPNRILIIMNDRNPRLHDVYSVDLTSGERQLVEENDIGAFEWFADNDFIVRIAQVPAQDGGFQLMHRFDSNDDWKPLITWHSEDVFGSSVVGFTSDNESLYVITSVGSNSAQLRKYNVRTNEEKVIAFDPTYDVSHVLVHPVSREIQAVSFTRDRSNWEVLDPGIRKDFKRLGELHRGDFAILNRDAADTKWLVAFTQDKGSNAYFIWERDKEETFLFYSRPDLGKWNLAEMKPVSFPSRDGLTIHAYLSLPPDRKPEQLPAVMLVHGGPWSRNTWGFNQEVQWLTSRGYAVLQVNFRGSTGYGKDFTNAGDKEWGGKMQDDISDGALWLIANGIADPGRIGIFGTSYGGYAVLSGLTKTPELYACGVDLVGPSNLITFQKTIPPYWEPVRPLIYRRIGHPEEDRDLLHKISPLNHIDKIRAPLMIVQGANDPRIKRAESIQIRDALQNAGKTVEYIEFEDEGHGLVKPANKLKFHAAAERFLAEHLGGMLEE